MMKKLTITLFSVLLWHTEAFALNIFACEPEWAALTGEIAKGKADIYSATTPTQDVHFIQSRPSLIAQIRKADLVVCSGADLEIGWLPLILRKAGSSKVQEGGSNLIYAAHHINTIEKPVRIDRADGDIHPDGNPHLHLNPYNILKMASVIADKLADIDSENAAFYRENEKAFTAGFSASIKKWKQKAETLNGISVIANHRNMSYLFDWLNIKTAGTLEPKPGIPATSKHLSELTATVRRDNVRFIVHAPFESAKPAQWLSGQTGVKTVVLPYTVGGNEQAKTLPTLFENSIELMLQAMEK